MMQKMLWSILNDPCLQVEDVMFLTLQKNHIDLSDISTPSTVVFKLKLPPQAKEKKRQEERTLKSIPQNLGDLAAFLRFYSPPPIPPVFAPWLCSLVL